MLVKGAIGHKLMEALVQRFDVYFRVRQNVIYVNHLLWQIWITHLKIHKQCHVNVIVTHLCNTLGTLGDLNTFENILNLAASVQMYEKRSNIVELILPPIKGVHLTC